MVARYNQAATANSPKWSSQARFRIASAAHDLADDIHSIPVKTQAKLSPTTKEKFKLQADRLRRLAKKYYSANLLARRKEPQRYRSNPWIKKSAVRLKSFTQFEYRPSQDYATPSALSMDLPQQWGG